MNLREDRQIHYATKPLRLRMPKLTSSPILCSVWEPCVTDQSKPGRTKSNGMKTGSNGFWKLAISKI